MAAVLEFAGVTVRRGDAVLLDSIDWIVEEDERWVVLGPDGAGKTTLLRWPPPSLRPTPGVAGILEEVLGTVDVFEAPRPRVELDQRGAGRADPARRDRARRGGLRLLRRGARLRVARCDKDRPRPRGPTAGEGLSMVPRRAEPSAPLAEGERQSGADRPRPDERPMLLLGAPPRAGPRRARGLVSALSVLAMDPELPGRGATTPTSRRSRRVSHALLLREGRVVAAGLWDQVLTEQHLSETFGCRC